MPTIAINEKNSLALLFCNSCDQDFFFLSLGVGQLMIQKGMLLLISWESRNCIDMSLAVHMCGAAELGP